MADGPGRSEEWGGGGAKLEDRSVFAELIKEALATN